MANAPRTTTGSVTSGEGRRRQRIAVRQTRLIELARSIAPMAGKSLDDNDVRTILAAIVRRWSMTVPVTYVSAGSPEDAKLQREHVVPVRVIVDRMIKAPRTVDRLLRSCVVLAEVTAAEHRQIGTMLGTHVDLYAEMKRCGLGEVVGLGWQRYRRQGVEVVDADGRTPWNEETTA